MDTIHIGCNCLIIENNKILLGKRKNCFGEGTYGLPGGHLEYGEKMIDAAKRELLEECGIQITDLEFNSLIDQAGPDRHYIQVNFLVHKYEGEIKCLEPECCEGWEWIDLNHLPDNLFPPHISVIEAYKRKQVYSY